MTADQPRQDQADTTPPRVLLVGTVLSVTQLGHTLAVAQPKPLVLGCIVTNPVTHDADAPDNPARSEDPQGSLNGLTALGGLDQIPQIVVKHRIDLVLVSLPQPMAQQTRTIAQTLNEVGIPWRFMPTLGDQLAGKVSTPWGPHGPKTPTHRSGNSSTSVSSSITIQSHAWSIDPVAILDRVPQPLNQESIRRTITGRNILITGAGGSIGSELARIVCTFNPARLILVERSENALFEIDREIAHRFPAQARAAVLHDVSDAAGTLAVLTAQKPSVIFHAAAHKHVPMMEDHPAQAVENNFYGTRSIADAACKIGTDRFVMISSDKAVNPSSVMGATKRLAELYIQYLNARCETIFSMVRFGNVLGSACSVLPIWSEQLARGGPITVTHPDMTRYFMTIPEAAGLVLQSAALSNADGNGGGEVFLLDMGEPIRILDLAKRFIQSHGLTPDLDIKIQFTGARPGEKLFEELAYDREDLLPTPHQSVRVWTTTAPQPERMQAIIAQFDKLRGKADDHGRHLWQNSSAQDILSALRQAVPEMIDPVAQATRLPAAG